MAKCVGLVRQWWVTVKLVVTALLAVVALAVAAPGLGRAADAATSAGQDVTQLQQVVATVTPSLALSLLVLNAALGVFQPGRRERNRARRRAVHPSPAGSPSAGS